MTELIIQRLQRIQTVNWSTFSLTHGNIPEFQAKKVYGLDHRLRTPNEGINQRYLKNWANVADTVYQTQYILKGIRMQH